MSNPKLDVQFTFDQLHYLENLFPHTTYGPTATEAQMHHYFGCQHVLDVVRNKTRGLNAREVHLDVNRR